MYTYLRDRRDRLRERQASAGSGRVARQMQSAVFGLGWRWNGQASAAPAYTLELVSECQT
jgi:hypothetical protein